MFTGDLRYQCSDTFLVHDYFTLQLFTNCLIKTALTFLCWKITTDEQELNTTGQLINCYKIMEDRKRYLIKERK